MFVKVFRHVTHYLVKVCLQRESRSCVSNSGSLAVCDSQLTRTNFESAQLIGHCHVNHMTMSNQRADGFGCGRGTLLSLVIQSEAAGSL